MKISYLIASLTLGSFIIVTGLAQNTGPAATPSDAQASAITAELKDLVGRVSTKINSGERSPEQLASEIAEFDALLAKHPEKNEETAQVAVMKAMLYLQVFNDEAKGRDLLAAVKTDFPKTQVSANVDRMLAQLDRARAAKAASAALVGKPAPELHFKWSSLDGVKTLSELKGNVVVLDFWATWCGPCFDAFPALAEWHQDLTDDGLTIIGVTRYYGRAEGFTVDLPNEIAFLKRFKEKHDLRYDFAVATQPDTQNLYAATSLPTAVVIDRKGVIRYIESGTNPSRIEEMRATILKLLAEK